MISSAIKLLFSSFLKKLNEISSLEMQQYRPIFKIIKIEHLNKKRFIIGNNLNALMQNFDAKIDQ